MSAGTGTAVVLPPLPPPVPPVPPLPPLPLVFCSLPASSSSVKACLRQHSKAHLTPSAEFQTLQQPNPRLTRHPRERNHPSSSSEDTKSGLGAAARQTTHAAGTAASHIDLKAQLQSHLASPLALAAAACRGETTARALLRE